MNRKLLSLAVATALCASFAEARFYIGVEGGYTGGAYDAKKIEKGFSNGAHFSSVGTGIIGDAFKDKTYGDFEVKPWKGFNVALDLGTEHFFANNYLGLRWGASVGYTEVMHDATQVNPLGKTPMTFTRGYVDAGLSADMMVNFFSSSSASFGIFGGVEMDYHYLVVADVEVAPHTKSELKDLPSRHSMELAGRVGVSTLIAKHHRIDLTAKLPFGYITSVANNEVKISGFEPIKTSFNVGYKYVF